MIDIVGFGTGDVFGNIGKSGGNLGRVILSED